MADIANNEATDRLLSALGEQLAALGQRFELVVIGGSGLLALGLIERSTRDVDVLALRAGDRLGSAKPLPAALEAARDRVARDFSLPPAGSTPARPICSSSACRRDSSTASSAEITAIA